MIRRMTLPNGVRLAADQMEGVRSCAIGFWLEIGSRHERGEEYGLTHFIEHMLFKGTPRHGALELADEMNRLGGQFNAHTGQETLCLHARCVDEKAPEVLDLLSEMLLDSTFPEDEMARERNVILEEFKMYEDNPDDFIFDLFFKTLWPRGALGRPVIGTPTTIRKFSGPLIKRYLAREFDPSRLIVVIAGSFDQRKCFEILKGRLGRRSAHGRAKLFHSTPIRNGARIKLTTRPIEQAHFCFGTLGPPRGSLDRYAFGLANMVLGGSMSSRLFKEVREKRGLAYSIHSFAQSFRGAGSFGVAGSTSPATLGEVLRISMVELNRLCEEKVSTRELDLNREQILDSTLMGVESTSARMMHLADALLTFNRPIPPEEIVREVKRLTPEAVQGAARKYLRGRALAGAFIGPKGTNLRAFRRIRID